MQVSPAQREANVFSRKLRRKELSLQNYTTLHDVVTHRKITKLQ